MSRFHLRRPSTGLVLAVVALFVALGGGAYAATSDTKTDKKIAKKAAKNYFNGHIGSASVSHANTAGSAGNANSATNASHATSADSASSLGGQKFGDFSGVTGAGGTKSVTVGSFVISNTNTGAGCGPTRVAGNSNFFLVSGVPGGVNGGAAANGAPFGAVIAAGTAAQVAAANAYNVFDAVLANGGSQAWGSVGAESNGASCVTSGGVFGT